MRQQFKKSRMQIPALFAVVQILYNRFCVCYNFLYTDVHRIRG